MSLDEQERRRRPMSARTITALCASKRGATGKGISVPTGRRLVRSGKGRAFVQLSERMPTHAAPMASKVGSALTRIPIAKDIGDGRWVDYVANSRGILREDVRMSVRFAARAIARPPRTTAPTSSVCCIGRTTARNVSP